MDSELQAANSPPFAEGAETIVWRIGMMTNLSRSPPNGLVSIMKIWQPFFVTFDLELIITVQGGTFTANSQRHLELL